MDGQAAWPNALHAFADSPFVFDLAAAISNSGETDAAKRWLLTLAVNFLQSEEQPYGALAAYDFAYDDFEQIGRAWPVMRESARLLDATQDTLALLARFVAERLPAIWRREPWHRHEPITRALILAERAHDLVALFHVGLKPNGSKDPFALRRAANHWLMQVVCPITVGQTSEATPQPAPAAEPHKP